MGKLDLTPPEWMEDIPWEEPADGWKMDGDEGQWPPQSDPEEDAFSGRAERLVEQVGGIRPRLSIGSPAEIGYRALLDMVHGDESPKRDWGDYDQVKGAVTRAYVRFADAQLWVYQEARGYWRPDSVSKLELQVQQYDGIEYGSQKKNGNYSVKFVTETEVHSATALACRYVGDAGFFDRSRAAVGLALKSVFVSAVDGRLEMRPHSPWNRARSGYAFDLPATIPDYDDWGALGDSWAQVCPAWHGMLSKILDGREDAGRLLQELIGVSLVGQATQYQTAAILLGSGGNGKGTLIKALAQMFPAGSVSQTDPTQWGALYERTALVGKLLNIVTETDGRKVKNLAAFKAVITGDPIEVRWIGKDPTTAVPIAGHLLSMNALPDGVDAAALSRFQIIECRARLRGGAGQVQEERLLEMCRSEMAGMVLWALHGLQRVQRQGRLTTPADSARIKGEWQDMTDPLVVFLRELTVEEQGATIGRTDLYRWYEGWCQKESIADAKRLDGTGFKARLNRMGFADGQEGKMRVKIYHGIRMRTEADPEPGERVLTR